LALSAATRQAIVTAQRKAVIRKHVTPLHKVVALQLSHSRIVVEVELVTTVLPSAAPITCGILCDLSNSGVFRISVLMRRGAAGVEWGGV